MQEIITITYTFVSNLLLLIMNPLVKHLHKQLLTHW